VAACRIVYLLRVLDYGCASCTVLREQHSTGITDHLIQLCICIIDYEKSIITIIITRDFMFRKKNKTYL